MTCKDVTRLFPQKKKLWFTRNEYLFYMGGGASLINFLSRHVCRESKRGAKKTWTKKSKSLSSAQQSKTSFKKCVPDLSLMEKKKMVSIVSLFDSRFFFFFFSEKREKRFAVFILLKINMQRGKIYFMNNY